MQQHDKEVAAQMSHILLLKQPRADMIMDGQKSLENRTTSASIRGRIGIAVQNLLLGHVELTGSTPFTKEQLDAELPWDCCPVGHITYGSASWLATPMQSSGGPVRPAGVEAVVPVEKGVEPAGVEPAVPVQQVVDPAAVEAAVGVGCGACCRGACACCGSWCRNLGQKGFSPATTAFPEVCKASQDKIREVRLRQGLFLMWNHLAFYVATRSEPHQYFFKVTS